jgi:hypothetical protein
MILQNVKQLLYKLSNNSISFQIESLYKNIKQKI